MNENEKKEMQHLRELLHRLQELQLSLYGNGKVTMDIELTGYKHGISVNVWTGVSMLEACSNKNLKVFSLCVWEKPERNENICNGIIRYVKKHSA